MNYDWSEYTNKCVFNAQWLSERFWWDILSLTATFIPQIMCWFLHCINKKSYRFFPSIFSCACGTGCSHNILIANVFILFIYGVVNGALRLLFCKWIFNTIGFVWVLSILNHYRSHFHATCHAEIAWTAWYSHDRLKIIVQQICTWQMCALCALNSHLMMNRYVSKDKNALNLIIRRLTTTSEDGIIFTLFANACVCFFFVWFFYHSNANACLVFAVSVFFFAYTAL